MGIVAALVSPGWAGAAEAEDIPIEAVDLEALLSYAPAEREAGSFGLSLHGVGFQPYLHAYATVDWVQQQGSPNTFDIHYFNVFVGANMDDRIVPELQLEHEHGDEFSLRYAQIDVRLADGIYARVGQFLVPFGQYNEYYYPEYLSLLPRSPLSNGATRRLIPVVWSEGGAQLRGSFRGEADRGVDVALYVVNGLEQADDPATPQVEDGGAIRDMRENLRDTHNPNKAVGIRIDGHPASVLEIGASAYTVAYTEDAARRLTLLGAHGGVEAGKFVLRAEGAVALQEAAAGDLLRWGVYARAGYAVKDWLQPVVGVDVLRQDQAPEDDSVGILASVNLRPWPELAPTFLFRVAGGHYINSGVDVADDIIMAQATVGF